MSQDLTLFSIITDLTETESKVYAELLKHGFATSSYVSEYMSINEQKVIDILKKLEEMKLAISTSGPIKKYIAVRPYADFIKKLDEFENNCVNTYELIENYDKERKQYFNAISSEINSQVKYLVQKTADKIGQAQERTSAYLLEKVPENQKTIISFAADIPNLVSANLDTSYDEFKSNISQKGKEFGNHSEKAVELMLKELQAFLKDTRERIAKIQSGLQTQMSMSLTKLDESIGDSRKELQTHADEFYSEISKVVNDTNHKIGEAKNNSVEELKSTIATIKSELRETGESITAKIREIKSSSMKKIETMEANSKEDLKTKQNEIENQLKELFSEFDKKNSELHASMELKIKKTNKTIISILKSLQKELKNISNAVKKDFKSFLDELRSVLEKNTDQIKKKISELTEEAVENNKEIISKTTSRSAESLQTIQKSLKNDKKEIVSELSRLVEEQHKQLSDKFMGLNDEKIQKIGDSSTSALKKQVNMMLEEIDKIFQGKVKELASQIKEHLPDTAEVKIAAAGITQDINKYSSFSTNLFKAKTGELVTSVENGLKQDFGNLNDELRKKVDSDVKSALKEISMKTELVMDGKLDSITKILENSENEFKSINEKIIKETEQLETSIKKDVNQRCDEFGSELAAKISEIQQKIDKQADDLLKTLEPEINPTIQKIENERSEIEPTISELFNNIKQKSEAEHQNITDSVEDLVNNLQEEVNKVNKSVLATIEDEANIDFDSLNATFEKFATGSMEKGESILEVEEIDTKSLEDQFSTHIKQIVSVLDSGKDLVKDTIDKETAKWVDVLGDIEPKIEKSMEFSRNKLHEELEILNSSIEKSLDSYQETINSSKDNVAKGAKENLSILKQDIEEHFNQFNDKLRKTMQDLQKFSAISTKELTDNTDSLLNESQKQFEELTDPIFDDCKTFLTHLNEEAGKPLMILRKSWNQIFRQDLHDFEKSWLIPGRQSIMNYILNMVNRAKKSIIITFPIFELLDLKRLSRQNKNGVTVKIYTKCGLISKKKRSKLEDENIEVYDSEDTDLILAIRDVSEEILISPFPVSERKIKVEAKKGKKATLPNDDGNKHRDVAIVSVDKILVSKLTEFTKFITDKAKRFQ